MSIFAKLFTVGEDQVLLFTEYDVNTDTTTVHQITSAAEIRAVMKVEIAGFDQEEKSARYLNNFKQHNAEKLRTMLVDMLNSDDVVSEKTIVERYAESI